MLSWRFVETDQLKEAELRDMIALYRRYNDCGEALARSFITDGRACLFSRRGSDDLLAYFLESERLVSLRGERVLLVKLNSFYALPEARGDVGLVLAAFQSLLRLRGRHPLARLYAVSDVREDSYRWYRQSLRSLWSLRHEDLPERARSVLEYASRHLVGAGATFDARRGSLLQPDRPCAARRCRGDEASREFERLLPDAAENEFLLVVGELSLANTGPALSRGIRRFMRRRGSDSTRSRPSRPSPSPATSPMAAREEAATGHVEARRSEEVRHG